MKNILEQLFGSKTRVRLLRIFLHAEEGKSFFVRELTRAIGAQINAVRNELGHLLNIGVIHVVENKEDDSSQKKFYALNTESLLVSELRALFIKAQIMVEQSFTERLLKVGPISYFALTGFFVSDESTPVDLIAIGSFQKEKFSTLIRAFEKEIGREIRYTTMTEKEFRYRRDVTDRFLYAILDARKMVVMDTITHTAASDKIRETV